MSNNEEALISLAELLGVPIVQLDFKRRKPKLTPVKNQYALLVAIADMIAKTPEDYLELDYIMSMHKDLSELNEDLRNYIELRGHDVLFQLTRKINKTEK